MLSLGSSLPSVRSLGVAFLVIGAAAGAQVTAEQKLSALQGGIATGLDAGDAFGTAVSAIGDLNGDTIPDAIVGAPFDDGVGPDRGAIWTLFLDSDGSVKSRQKVNAFQGGLTGPLDDLDQFGTSVAYLGDLDGDSIGDVAVGAPKDDDGGTNHGAVYILFLNGDGTVKAEQKISSTAGGFTGSLDALDVFGTSVAALGDVDGDTVTDLAVGAPQDDDGGTDRGAIWVLFLNSDGTVKAHQKISATNGGFLGTLDDFDLFGSSLALVGDLAGDGGVDLAVGAPRDDDEGNNRGAVWIFEVDGFGIVTAGSEEKINATNVALDDRDNFGSSLAFLGDFDGFLPALAVGATGDDDGAEDQGALWILSLSASPTDPLEIPTVRKISATQGGLTGPLMTNDSFGSAVTLLGDLDGDGVGDLAVGARRDDDGGMDTGAIWHCFLGGLADVTLRSGQGTNPPCYEIVSLPVLGQTWRSTIDIQSQPSALTTFIIGFDGFFDPGVNLRYGELLVDPFSNFFVSSTVSSAGGPLDLHEVAVNTSPLLIGFTLYTQGGILAPGQVTLCNGYDLHFGF